MTDAKRDNNQVPTLLAVSNADGSTPVTLYADPTTHRLLVSMNSETTATGTASTTDATVTTLITVALSVNTVYQVRATVAGNETSDADRLGTYMGVTAYRAGGGAVIQGFTTSFHSAKSDATWGDPTFDVSGNNLILTVQGKAGTNIDWSGIVYYLSL